MSSKTLLVIGAYLILNTGFSQAAENTLDPWEEKELQGEETTAVIPSPSPTASHSIEKRITSIESRLTSLEKPSEKTKAFDTVPFSQKKALMERLKMVGELIEKHGRAYDYRTLTSQELKTVLSDLNKTVR